MAIDINGFTFTGPYHIDENFRAVAGVYVLVDLANRVIDVGETSDLGSRIAGHERRPCWTLQNAAYVLFHAEAVQEKRLRLEKFLRLQYTPTCGVR